MKFFNKLFLLVLFMNLLLMVQSLKAQQAYTLAPDPNLKVTGTSTIHDWDMVSNEASGEAMITIENGKLKEISSLRIVMYAESLKSGKGQMDKIAFKSLKTDQYPKILFELTTVQQITEELVKATGNLTIAGTTQPVSLQVNYNLSGDSIRFGGQHFVKFSEFNMDPPTAVLGTIKTGDDLRLHFEVNFESTNIL